MKKLLFILAFGFLELSNALSQTDARIKVVSKEDQSLDGSTEIEMSYYFSDSTSLSGDPQLSLKTGWNVLSFQNLTPKTFYYQETTIIKVSISHPLTNLPFFPITIPVKHLVTFPDTFYLETEAKLYFTPYNTIEIWNIEDFTNLPRNWISADDNFDTTRVFVSRFDVPQSDYMPVLNYSTARLSSSFIPNSIDPSRTSVPDTEQVILADTGSKWKNLFVSSLAYTIPFKPVSIPKNPTG